MDKTIKNTIDSHWSHVLRNGKRVNWWNSKRIISHINTILCGNNSNNFGFGQRQIIKANFNLPFKKGISIGAGICTKEIQFVKEGICDHFDIYELSEHRIELARNLVAKNNLSDHFSFYHEDYFSIVNHNTYDLFHWDNSIHHMMNTELAVKMSYLNLNPGGCFYCNDYIGQTYYQHTDQELLIVNTVRKLLPEILFNSDKPDVKFPRLRERPNLEQFKQRDPSEAADSSNILPSIKKYFPDATIINLGGLIYAQVLVQIIMNIPDDSELMDRLLILDQYLSERGFNQYIFAYAKKD